MVTLRNLFFSVPTKSSASLSSTTSESLFSESRLCCGGSSM